MFRKLKAAMTGGGTTVETTLHGADVRPGESVAGEVHIVGGEIRQDIQYLKVALAARVEVESGDVEHDATQEFAVQRLTESFTLEPGAEHRVPFSLTVPWETPFNVVDGRTLPQVRIGLATELEIARSVDKGDLDPLRIHPLAAQETILQALVRAGLRFKHADLEKGSIRGATLPFYGEFEFSPPDRFRHVFNEVEVTFLTRAGSMDVILEGDRRGGFLSEGSDEFSRFEVDFASAGSVDWVSVITKQLEHLGRRRGLFG
jgi:sporulation-control protein